MSDDTLATPVSKLPAVSTRDAPKVSGGNVSYADILKQQEMDRSQMDDTVPQQPQFQEPLDQRQYDPLPQERYMDHTQDHMRDHIRDHMRDQTRDHTRSMDSDMYGYQGGSPYPVVPPPPPPPPRDTVPPKKWWKVWIFQNKIGWIVGLVIFLLLTFVYPRVRGMARFAGAPLPYWATGGMSALGAAMVTAINISV